MTASCFLWQPGMYIVTYPFRLKSFGKIFKLYRWEKKKKGRKRDKGDKKGRKGTNREKKGGKFGKFFKMIGGKFFKMNGTIYIPGFFLVTTAKFKDF